MTKPQLSGEPSMEDILASIRKMISEERIGPRPIPDQMSRTSYGESSPAARSAAPAASEARPDTRTEVRSERPESRVDPRSEALPQRTPMPADRPAPAADRFGRAPGEGARPTAERAQPERSAPERPLQERGPIDRGAAERADRSGPSFSSLSDALKAAKSPTEQRRSLEEKIADMLETGPGTPAPGTAPADPLAVFSGSRTLPAGASAAPVRPAGAPAPDAKSAPSRAPATTSGAAAPANLRPGDPGAAVPPRDYAQAKPTAPAASASASKPATATPAAEKPAERIIAMPSRLPAASGAGQAGVASSTSPLNGAGTAASPAAAPFGVKQTPRPETPADKTADKTMAPPKDASPLSAERKAPETPHTPGQTTGLTPRPIPGEPQVQGPASAPAQPHMRAPDTPAAREAAAAPPVSEAAKMESALADLLAQSQERAGKTPPSEALIDELVDLVHNEPSTLSVFTSGNAFIHGVGSHPPHADHAPDAETQSTALQTINGAGPPKLDRNAAELLRPMLRQWLADNMPRIVEEALRSELMSGQGGPKDSDKT